MREVLKCCSVARSRLTFCDPMDCSTPGFSVPHHLLEFAQVHVHWISDAIQPSLSVSIFSLCLQPFPASGSFPVSQLFASGGQSIGASVPVLAVSIQIWFPLRLTGFISLLSKGLSRVFSRTTVQNHKFFSQFFIAPPSLWFSSHIHTWLPERPQPWLH